MMKKTDDYRKIAHRFYNSKPWINCRAAYIAKVIERLGAALCETCYVKGELTPGYIVHHKIPLNASNINDPEISLNHKHLKYECLDCHNRELTEEKSVTREGLRFTEDGDLVEG